MFYGIEPKYFGVPGGFKVHNYKVILDFFGKFMDKE